MTRRDHFGLLSLLLASLFLASRPFFVPLSKSSMSLNAITTNSGDLPRKSTVQRMSMKDGTHHSCRGRQVVMNVLSQANVLGNLTTGSSFDCLGFPSDQDIASLYGVDGPIIIGLESCREYRDMIRLADSGGSIPRIAGMYNTGTNAMAKLLRANWNDDLPLVWHLPRSYFKFDVPWGKHVPASLYANVTVPPHNPTPKQLVLPIVMVRDPLWWMSSLCKHPYGAHWRHREDHCPNLVPDKQDESDFKLEPNITNPFPVDVKYHFGRQQRTQIKFKVPYQSIVDVWNKYNREYYDSGLTRPRLMVRFEDILFNGPSLVKSLSDCLGFKWSIESFKYVLEESKTHGSGAGSGFLSGLMRYGSHAGRLQRWTGPDLEYAKRHLDQDLLDLFHYSLP